MSEQNYPAIVCDGRDGFCVEAAMDHTLHGLGVILGSATQLPTGWTGPIPGQPDGRPHLCPDCTREAAEASR